MFNLTGYMIYKVQRIWFMSILGTYNRGNSFSTVFIQMLHCHKYLDVLCVFMINNSLDNRYNGKDKNRWKT